MVTVDCGAAAYDAIAAAAQIGLEVVVIDHHLMREDPPPAAAVVNPNRPGCNSGQGNLAAAGVAFVLLAALNREARRRGLFAERSEPDLRQWLDLAAMGAICDVTPLTGFNRALATLGLRVMSGWTNPGLAALMHTAKAEGDAGVFQAGFILGPRINAGGRIGRADLGARLLSTDDAAEAQELAQQLDALNASRKDVERDVTEQAIAAVEAGPVRPDSLPAIVVSGEGWHPGVVGIVAGRLRERYRRLMAGGGHAMAAGLTIRAEGIGAFTAFLCERLSKERAEAFAQDTVEIDALVTPRAADRALYDDFQRLAPFGPGNPEPMFALAEVSVDQPQMLRGGHVRCVLSSAGAKLKAIAWRAEDTELGRRLMAGGGGLNVAGRLKPDDWNGRHGVQLEIEDVADPRRNG